MFPDKKLPIYLLLSNCQSCTLCGWWRQRALTSTVHPCKKIGKVKFLTHFRGLHSNTLSDSKGILLEIHRDDNSAKKRILSKPNQFEIEDCLTIGHQLLLLFISVRNTWVPFVFLFFYLRMYEYRPISFSFAPPLAHSIIFPWNDKTALVREQNVSPFTQLSLEMICCEWRKRIGAMNCFLVLKLHSCSRFWILSPTLSVARIKVYEVTVSCLSHIFTISQ